MDSEEILQRIKEIEIRAAKATPGPWESDGVRVYSDHSKCKYGLVADCDLELAIKGAEPQLPYDPDFIAHTREDTPWMCELARKLLAVAEAARVVTEQAQLQFDWEDLVGMSEFSGALEKLHQALAALEEVQDVQDA